MDALKSGVVGTGFRIAGVVRLKRVDFIISHDVISTGSGIDLDVIPRRVVLTSIVVFQIQTKRE